MDCPRCQSRETIRFGVRLGSAPVVTQRKLDGAYKRRRNA